MRFLLLALSLVFAPMLGSAQGTLYFSNLAAPSTNSVAIGADFWIAQAFNPQPGSDRYFGDYILNSIQLSVTGNLAIPGGFVVSIYGDSVTQGRVPVTLLGQLAGPDPSAAGIYSYSASDIVLHTSHNYFVVVTASTPVASSVYNWSTARTTDFSGQWPLFDYNYSSPDGVSWTRDGAGQNPFQFAIYATPIPEPALPLFLSACGLASVLLRRCGCRAVDAPMNSPAAKSSDVSVYGCRGKGIVWERRLNSGVSKASDVSGNGCRELSVRFGAYGAFFGPVF